MIQQSKKRANVITADVRSRCPAAVYTIYFYKVDSTSSADFSSSYIFGCSGTDDGPESL
jgi:hypothetical protein